MEENRATCSESSIGVEMRSLARPNLFTTDSLCLVLLDGVINACAANLGVTFSFKAPLEDLRGDCGTLSQRRCCSSILSTSDKAAASNSKPNEKLKEALGDGALAMHWSG